MDNISEYFFKQQLDGFNKKYKYFKLENDGASMVHKKHTKKELQDIDTSNWSFCGFEGKAPIFEETVHVSEEDLAKHAEIHNDLTKMMKNGDLLQND